MNVILVCAHGVSTGMFSRRLNQEARKRGMTDFSSQAVSYLDVDQYLKEADVVLVGPQVRIIESKLKALCESQGIQCLELDAQDFGTMNVGRIMTELKSLSEIDKESE